MLQTYPGRKHLSTTSARAPLREVSGPEHVRYGPPRLDDLERTAHVALVLDARVDLQGLAEGAEQVRHRHGPLGDLDAVLVRGSDDAAAAHAGTGQSHVERLRIVVAPGVLVDVRHAPEL